MFQIEIKFKSEGIKDINKVLNVIKKQIKEGEIFFDDKGNKIDGYIINKYNNIAIWDKDGYSIGQFRILEEELIKLLGD